jgi:hypothetical protein
MRQAKLLTLAAVVGLSLINSGNSAHSQVANFPGTVPPSCTLTSTDGTFSEDGTPATLLVANGGDRGTVTVNCNQSGKSLSLTINTAASTVYNGTGKIRFGGTTGVFAGVNTPGFPTTAPITAAIANPTAAIGDVGRVQSQIEAPTGKLLKAANNYKLVVDATITP